MPKRRFSLAELFVWTAFCGILLACVIPPFRELVSIRDFSGPRAMTISADGSIAAAADHQGRVRLWDLNLRVPLSPIRTKASWIEGIALSNDGGLLAISLRQSAGPMRGDGIEVWSISSGKRIDAFQVDWRASFGFSPRGPMLAAIVDNQVELRSYGDGTATVPIQIESGVKPARALAFSADGRSLAIGGYDGVEILDADDWTCKSAIEAPVADCRSLSISPDGRWLLVGSISGARGERRFASLKVYDRSTGEIEGTFDEETNDYHASVCYLPGGRILFAANDHLRILTEHLDAGGKEPIDCEERIRYVAAPFMGTNFLAGGNDSVALWDATALSPVWMLWDSSSSVNRSKQKFWRSLIFLPVIFLWSYFSKLVRRQNHRCLTCHQRFLPQTSEDWALGCPTCCAAGRIQEQKIARFEQSQRLMRFAPIIATVMAAIAFLSIGVFCRLKQIPLQPFSPLGNALATMAVVAACSWVSYYLQPKRARRDVLKKAQARSL